MAYKAFSNSGTVWRGLPTRGKTTICMAKSSISVDFLFEQSFCENSSLPVEEAERHS
ncbi:hypothetical protein [Bartonella elizabethae]|uniref:hypothetical protein n=1 Tax=Bartonella elizabethae TaxID=807 RepID=UPI0002F0F9A9|nr:hypothetical protein [Bartonella elizabethae]